VLQQAPAPAVDARTGTWQHVKATCAARVRDLIEDKTTGPSKLGRVVGAINLAAGSYLLVALGAVPIIRRLLAGTPLTAAFANLEWSFLGLAAFMIFLGYQKWRGTEPSLRESAREPHLARGDVSLFEMICEAPFWLILRLLPYFFAGVAIYAVIRTIPSVVTGW
jgi:hypothetical protein